VSLCSPSRQFNHPNTLSVSYCKSPSWLSYEIFYADANIIHRRARSMAPKVRIHIILSALLLTNIQLTPLILLFCFSLQPAKHSLSETNTNYIFLKYSISHRHVTIFRMVLFSFCLECLPKTFTSSPSGLLSIVLTLMPWVSSLLTRQHYLHPSLQFPHDGYMGVQMRLKLFIL